MVDLSSKQAKMNSLLNRKRKVETGAQPAFDPTPGTSSQSVKLTTEDTEQKDPEGEETRRKAAEAILRDSKRAKERAELVGPQGWLRPKSLNTNKQFLHRTLVSTLSERKPKRTKSPSDYDVTEPRSSKGKHNKPM